MEREDKALTRADFSDAEEWACYLHKGGLDEHDDPTGAASLATGRYGALWRAKIGCDDEVVVKKPKRTLIATRHRRRRKVPEGLG